MKLTAIIEAEGDGYVSLCPEVNIASQADSIAQTRDNLQEALELFFETASPEEIKQRFRRTAQSKIQNLKSKIGSTRTLHPKCNTTHGDLKQVQ
jgi:predicted RNase H-like HicB family nuclease